MSDAAGSAEPGPRARMVIGAKDPGSAGLSLMRYIPAYVLSGSVIIFSSITISSVAMYDPAGLYAAPLMASSSPSSGSWNDTYVFAKSGLTPAPKPLIADAKSKGYAPSMPESVPATA